MSFRCFSGVCFLVFGFVVDCFSSMESPGEEDIQVEHLFHSVRQILLPFIVV